jgi:hypothetical protein
MEPLCHKCDVTRTKTLRLSPPATRKLNKTHESQSSEPLGVRGVGSSNLPVPTKFFPLLLGFFASLRFASASHFANCDVIVTLSSDLTAFCFAGCRMCE